ncbi:response regulator transcription factor [Ruminococcaceae bacterium OttesenSCG-928-A16]|nr:response regulator transcription factor [Ruminococcaceae bacterium OttesenSCG-928-A16]
MVNVLLVEDSKITRDMVERYINMSQNYVLTTTLENAANAEIVCMKGKIDLVLMDVCTADDESGLEAAAKIKKHYPTIKVIAMTSMPEHSFIQKAKEAGCESFWYKEYGNMELIDVMNRTMQGESVYPDKTPAIAIGNVNSGEITEQEMIVLRQLCLGYKYEEIAENLSITLNTVKFHAKNLLAKTGYRSTLQLVVDVVSKRLVLPKF